MPVLLRDSSANLSQNILCILRLLFSTAIIFEIFTQKENPIPEFDTPALKMFSSFVPGIPIINRSA